MRFILRLKTVLGSICPISSVWQKKTFRSNMRIFKKWLSQQYVQIYLKCFFVKHLKKENIATNCFESCNEPHSVNLSFSGLEAFFPPKLTRNSHFGPKNYYLWKKLRFTTTIKKKKDCEMGPVLSITVWTTQCATLRSSYPFWCFCVFVRNWPRLPFCVKYLRNMLTFVWNVFFCHTLETGNTAENSLQIKNVPHLADFSFSGVLKHFSWISQKKTLISDHIVIITDRS